MVRSKTLLGEEHFSLRVLYYTCTIWRFSRHHHSLLFPLKATWDQDTRKSKYHWKPKWLSKWACLFLIIMPQQPDWDQNTHCSLTLQALIRGTVLFFLSAQRCDSSTLEKAVEKGSGARGKGMEWQESGCNVIRLRSGGKQDSEVKRMGKTSDFRPGALTDQLCCVST